MGSQSRCMQACKWEQAWGSQYEMGPGDTEPHQACLSGSRPACIPGSNPSYYLTHLPAKASGALPYTSPSSSWMKGGCAGAAAAPPPPPPPLLLLSRSACSRLPLMSRLLWVPAASRPPKPVPPPLLSLAAAGSGPEHWVSQSPMFFRHSVLFLSLVMRTCLG